MGQAKYRAAEIAQLKATGPKKKADVVENKSVDRFSSVPPEVQIAQRAELEVARRAQWKGAIEQELQLCVQEAAKIRKTIAEAKTKHKKELYGKKFASVQSKVMQMVAALQRLQAQEKAQSAAPEPHVHDEHCNHEHKDNEPAPSQAQA
jgi:hypothetical protein